MKPNKEEHIKAKAQRSTRRKKDDDDDDVGSK